MVNPFDALKSTLALIDKVKNRDLYEKLVELMGSVQALTEENIALKKKLRQTEDEARSDGELEFRSLSSTRRTILSRSARHVYRVRRSGSG